MSSSEEKGMSRPPTSVELLTDRAFRGLTRGFAWLTILLVLYLIYEIGKEAWPQVQKYGTSFVTEKKWDGKEHFGILPEIWGTLYSSILGVGLGSLFGIAVAIFLTQEFLPYAWEIAIKNVVELLAAIP